MCRWNEVPKEIKRMMPALPVQAGIQAAQGCHIAHRLEASQDRDQMPRAKRELMFYKRAYLVHEELNIK